LIPAPDSAPERAETGTQNHEGIAGAAAAVDFLASLAPGPALRVRLDAAFRQLHERGDALITQLWNGLREIERVRLYGLPPGAARTPTIAFTINDVPSIEVAKNLAERGIFVSHGDFYAMTVVERLGLAPDGLVRAGCACYTIPEEIDRLLGAVAEL
jgi:selenocysteine lyase/cysteine desulfurase